ncbi:hypothetical protein [Entomobacter blattae]|uniref:Uncharacterized protein n=1 Tax=Entomobacter blattae TaxID=2762277 RepID=A0A7H1NPL9_9PROT|nr:hypothetical protein [Entomobacter blattae]QNT77729.1 hypothetical protein JGUZn3_04800 [Entomobacter blattae]
MHTLMLILTAAAIVMGLSAFDPQSSGKLMVQSSNRIASLVAG